jgi:hypothetical protein
VRPIVRGKQNKPVEFGAKLSVNLTGDGFARVDHLRWDAFHEGLDLKSQVENYHDRTGYYPERVLADPLYGTRENRRYLKQKGIHFAGKPLGRPKKVTEENREELEQLQAKRRTDYRASCKTPNFTSLYLRINLICIFKKIKNLTFVIYLLIKQDFQFFSKFRA